MKAVFYQEHGPAEVLQVGEIASVAEDVPIEVSSINLKPINLIFPQRAVHTVPDGLQ
jgi:hypothetical protein